MPNKKTLKLTITIDENFVADALAKEASERGISLEKTASEIIADWCDNLSLKEDLADHKSSIREYQEKRGAETKELFKV